MKKLLFIVNPRAGKTKSAAPLFEAVAAFSRAGYLVRVYVTEAGGQARDIAAKWGGQYDMVVCAGGDGTLNETISGLMALEQRPPLGYLPNGSTNDFAASLHLHTTVEAAARATAGGVPYPLDIGRHNDRYFAYVASFGAFTRSSYSASQAAKTPWATSPTYWRAWATWTPCAPTAAPSRRTASASRASSSSARCATPPPWADW